MLIAIDAIRENGNLRRVPASAQADAALTASIGAQGVLQPILVRPDGDNGGYVLVAGHRRLRCARSAGLAEVPAEIQTMTEGWALAAQATENMVRVAMHPVDQWRAVRDLMATDLALRDAAAAIGLDERQIQRMERLGMLDPKVLALIEASGAMPTDHYLRIIATAPPAKAAKAKSAVQEWNGEKRPQWHAIADACRVRRFCRGDALFDHGAMQWDVDFFAQPGAGDEYTTTDGETFMRLQRAALEAWVAERVAKKKRIRLVEFDSSRHEPRLPAGFHGTWGDFEKLKRDEWLFVALSDTGVVKKVIAEDVKAAKAAEKKKAERLAARAAPDDKTDDLPDSDAGDPDNFDDADDTPPPAPAEKPGITKDGMAMVNAAKTQALRETLRTGLSETPPERLLALMALTWSALNVSVSGEEQPDGDAYNPDRRHFFDVVAKLLMPGGGLGDISMADARTHTGEIMARVLSIRGDDWPRGGSREAAE